MAPRREGLFAKNSWVPVAWPNLDALAGVAEAVEDARSAIAAVRLLPANRRGWARTSAAAAIRSARASAMLDGGSALLDLSTKPVGDPTAPGGESAASRGDQLTAGSGLVIRPDDASEGDGADESADRDAATLGAGGSRSDLPAGKAAHRIVTDPVLAGALRVSAATAELAAVWRQAPSQALARLHTLAAADLAPDDELGRPRSGSAIAERLAALSQVVTAAPWSGPVLVAVVHGELLALRPFGSADGIVARAAARLTMVTTGLDPQALTVPEVGHLRAGAAYREAAERFASGEAEGLAAWIRHVCAALNAGAREARSIAAAAG